MPASSLVTHSSVQPQTSSKRSLIVAARPVFARKTAVGVDRQCRFLLGARPARRQAPARAHGGNTADIADIGFSSRTRVTIRKPPRSEDESGSGSRHDLNPSAGMIRIRFDGSAEFSASQPLGHPVR